MYIIEPDLIHGELDLETMLALKCTSYQLYPSRVSVLEILLSQTLQVPVPVPVPVLVPVSVPIPVPVA